MGTSQAIKNIGRITLRTLVVLALFLSLASCHQKAEAPKKPIIKFTETSYSFLEMIPGEKRKHVFEYTNTGNAPLMILNIEVECGCTVPTWSRDLLPPGGKGEIAVYFDSDMTAHGIRKNLVTVYSTADDIVTLALETEILYTGNN